MVCVWAKQQYLGCDFKIYIKLIVIFSIEYCYTKNENWLIV